MLLGDVSLNLFAHSLPKSHEASDAPPGRVTGITDWQVPKPGKGAPNVIVALPVAVPTFRKMPWAKHCGYTQFRQSVAVATNEAVGTGAG